MNAISSWDVYWITRLDSLFAVFVAMAIMCVVFVSFGLLFVFLECDEEESPATLRKIFWVAIFGAAMVVGAVLTPSTKEMCAIIILPRVINNQDVQAMGSDLPKLARAWLEELMPEPADKAKGE